VTPGSASACGQAIYPERISPTFHVAPSDTVPPGPWKSASSEPARWPGGPGITPELMEYVLACFTLCPLRFIDSHGHRTVTDDERAAAYAPAVAASLLDEPLRTAPGVRRA
jgi:hypothetical protein